MSTVQRITSSSLSIAAELDGREPVSDWSRVATGAWEGAGLGLGGIGGAEGRRWGVTPRVLTARSTLGGVDLDGRQVVEGLCSLARPGFGLEHDPVGKGYGALLLSCPRRSGPRGDPRDRDVVPPQGVLRGSPAPSLRGAREPAWSSSRSGFEGVVQIRWIAVRAPLRISMSTFESPFIDGRMQVATSSRRSASAAASRDSRSSVTR